MELAGKRVLITGASRGIGQALAERFTAAGARVALVARSEGPLKELADRLGGTAHPADLADRDQLDGLVDRIEADGGPVDVLVNNAGVDRAGFLIEMSADDVDFLYRLAVAQPLVGSDWLAEEVDRHGKRAEHLPERPKLGDALVAEARPGDRIVIMGARDDTLIDFARELVEQLEGRV